MFLRFVKINSTYEPSSPSGRSLSRFLRDEATRSIFTPWDGILVHGRVIPSIKFAGNHLYTWVERGTVRVKCLAQEHNTMCPARARIRTTRSGGERTNHEAIATKRYFRCCLFLSKLNFVHNGNFFHFLEQLKQFEENKVTAEELLDVVLNSSTQAPDSTQLLPGDLVMVMQAMNTAVSNMNPKQRMSAAKVRRSACLLFWFES